MKRLTLPLLFVLFFSAALQAAEEPTKFLRIGRDTRGRAMTLDTAVTRYEKDVNTPAPDGADQMVRKPITVDLVGAVHVGERHYYKALNKQFQEYDVLLYELVAPKGKKPDPNGGESPIKELIKVFLGLQHQLDAVDYTKENFVHADLSPIQLLAKMNKRGDTFFTIFLSTMADSMRQQNLQGNQQTFKNPKDIITDEQVMAGMLEAMLTEKGSPVLKRWLALQFGENPDQQMQAFGGSLGQLLIDDRNAAAMTVLEQQIASGKKKVGIFYGAGHMADFEKRLLKMGFKKKAHLWVPAWDLR